MKSRRGWICGIVFVVLCAAVVLFLRAFTAAAGSPMLPCLWQEGTVTYEDGGSADFDLNEYGQTPEPGALYRFTTTLDYETAGWELTFPVSGAEVVLYLDDIELCRVPSDLDPEIVNTTQISIPLPDDAKGGALSMDYRFLGGEDYGFPPLLRLTSFELQEASTMAYANHYALPAGASALALVLVAGLFLLGLAQRRPDWSLLCLVVAALVLTARQISVSGGYYFLPTALLGLLSWRGLQWLSAGALLVWILLNRRRGFLRWLALAAAVSTAALLAAYLVSLSREGRLAGFLNESFSSLFGFGYYDGLLYWLCLWLTLVSVAIAALGLIQSMAEARVRTQTLAMKNQLLMDSYRALEDRARQSASFRHELRNHISALNLMCMQGDNEGVREYLAELERKQLRLTMTQFCDNFAINAILQSAASRAAELGIGFDAHALAPASLAIGEGELCGILLNMLDNALEACAQVEDAEKRFIRFRCELKNGFLAISCTNSYQGSLRIDEKGGLLTTKADGDNHGFGLIQMRAVAEKYHSILDIEHDEGEFTVRTALQLPAA